MQDECGLYNGEIGRIPDAESVFVGSARETLAEGLAKIEHCVAQLSDDQLWWRPRPEMNSIANLMLHLSGNVRQWIIAGVGGAKDARNRPGEFADRSNRSREQVLGILKSTVDDALAVLARQTADDLVSPRRIQGFDSNVSDAIFSSISHFRGHVQEIIHMTRAARGEISIQFRTTGPRANFGRLIDLDPRMSDNYRIYPDWKDILVYDEGDGRTLRLDCDNMQEPYQVYLPSARLWQEQMPPWANERRQIIVDRILAANVVVCVVDGFVRSISSPDGAFRVDAYYEQDERGYPMRWVRVIAGDAIVASFDDATLAGVAQFPVPGEVILPLEIERERVQIGINLNNRTFWFHPNERPEPLDQLRPALASLQPPPFIPPLIRPSLRSLIGSIVLLSISLMFVAAGLFECFAGHTAHDRWIGVLGVIFFGVCGATSVWDVRRWLNRRRPIPPQK